MSTTSPPAVRAALTISDLAERPGVAQATLRSWEARYGFPQPARLAGGHRRYAEQDVAAVEEVLRHRRSGLGLEAAVRRALSEATPETMSLFAELRRRHPDLEPQLLSKKALVAISHAIEDESCARAERPLLFGGFQCGRFLRESYARWVELARTARAAVVFAHFADTVPARAGLPVEVAIPSDAPLKREWFVVCDAVDHPACMVAFERPGQDDERDCDRRFEAIWSADPQVVRDAARICAAFADTYRPGWQIGKAASRQGLEEQVPAASADLRRATDLLNRTMAYLDLSR